MAQTKEGFLLKLLRAMEHFESLELEVDAFLERRPYDAVREAEPERTQYRAKIKERIPARVPLLVGDFLQNTRSALDHLAFRLAGDKADRDTSFPIYAKREDYFAKSRGGKPATTSGVFKVAAFPEKAQTIIETMQPYHGHDLGMGLLILHTFARVDRHRLVHLVGGVSEEYVLRAGKRDERGELLMTPEGAEIGSTVTLGPFEHDAIVAAFTHPPDVEVECDFSYDVAMRESEPAGRFWPLLPTFAGMLAMVRDVFNALAPHLPAHVKQSWADAPVTKIDLGDMRRKIAAPGQPYVAGVTRRRRVPPSKG